MHLIEHLRELATNADLKDSAEELQHAARIIETALVWRRAYLRQEGHWVDRAVMADAVGAALYDAKLLP